MKLQGALKDLESLKLIEFKTIQDTGDLSLLVIRKPVSEDELAVRWAWINDEIAKLIGVNEDFIAYLTHKAKAIVFKHKGMREDRFFLNFAAIEESEAEAYAAVLSKGTASLNDELLKLSRFQGYHLDKNSISVGEYFTLVKQYNEHGAAKKF